MADSFQNEVPKARINLKLDLHTGGASKKMELPLKLLVAGDFSNGQESAQISEREKVNITKNNFDSVLSEYSPKLNLTVKNTLSEDGGEDSIQLTFQSMKDFTPEQVAAQICGLVCRMYCPTGPLLSMGGYQGHLRTGSSQAWTPAGPSSACPFSGRYAD
ncbi:type VI secretion system contractile sheath small subunit [Enterobacter asburiae]|nr:type VI secretion system contractile sheath small subunit [Enterobacter asburiae]MCK2174560.1 type VI secretion system contractile sheath small subunit [Enterobacter asburiae]